MKKFVFTLFCTVMFVVGFAGCKNEADDGWFEISDSEVTEEVLSITLSDGEWDMRMKNSFQETSSRNYNIGPACEIPEIIQWFIISQLEHSEAIFSGTSPYGDEYYYYYFLIFPEGSTITNISDANCLDYLEQLKKTNEEKYDEYENQYNQNKELFKEQYKQFIANWKPAAKQEIHYEYDRTNKNDYYIKILCDSNKIKIISSEKKITGIVKGDVFYFKKKYPSIPLKDDGTYFYSEPANHTEDDILEIINNISSMNTRYYTIKTNPERTKYIAEFDQKSGSYYETIYLVKK